MHADTATPRALALSAPQPRLLQNPIGLVALGFPWLFSSAWPVVALACAAVLGLRLRAARAAPGALRAHVLGTRPNDDVWLACGVCLTYLWSAAEPIAYCVAILVLVFAPIAATLVRRGLWPTQHASGGAGNSAAGSLAFFLTALVIAAGALFAGAGLRPGESLAAASLLATVTTGIEASMDDGLDNLFVPIGALVALEFAAL